MENPYPALMPVGPNECALAVAIPLTQEQFLADLSQPDEKDLVRHFIAERGLQKAGAEFCWEVYRDDEATFVEAVCLEAERFGVTVLREARLSDLIGLLNCFPVVTLVAHWRFVPVAPEDIRDVSQLLEILQVPDSHIRPAIRQAFELLDPQLLRTENTAHLSSSELRKRIAKVIGTTADKAERFYWDAAGQSVDPEQMPDELRDKLTRSEFEQALPDFITPARVVELQDRMYTVQELTEAVPENFKGLLDLTLCNSVIPAASIRYRRPDCLVAANRRPAELRARMYLYGLEISLLAKQSMPFVDVIKQVHTGQSAYQPKGRNLWKLFGRFFKIIQMPL